MSTLPFYLAWQAPEHQVRVSQTEIKQKLNRSKFLGSTQRMEPSKEHIITKLRRLRWSSICCMLLLALHFRV